MHTRVMLELGCNHQGDLDIARRLIDEAARLGVFGVKLQKRSPEEIPPEMRDTPRKPENSFGETYYEHRRALEFTVDEVAKLKEHAEAQGLAFAESVFDHPSLKQMLELGVKYIKLPSQFLNDPALNFELMLHRSNVSSLVAMHSTGMHTTWEVLENRWLRDYDVTFYCRSIYPHGVDQIDLGSARMIYGAIGDPGRCGYSSHDKDGLQIPWFIILGASWVERHFTLDKAMKGSDHHTVSSNPAEMRRILTSIEETEAMLECKNLNALVSKEEIAARQFYMGDKK